VSRVTPESSNHRDTDILPRLEYEVYFVIHRFCTRYLDPMNFRPSARALLESVAANVRRCRQKRDLTQEQLAELAGIELRSLQNIETGRTNLRVVTLHRLAEALGVAPAVLLEPGKLPTRPRGRPPGRRPGR
jgi:DNA-binding XRE family transcriptional regulator